MTGWSLRLTGVGFLHTGHGRRDSQTQDSIHGCFVVLVSQVTNDAGHASWEHAEVVAEEVQGTARISHVLREGPRGSRLKAGYSALSHNQPSPLCGRQHRRRHFPQLGACAGHGGRSRRIARGSFHANAHCCPLAVDTLPGQHQGSCQPAIKNRSSVH